MNQTYVFGLVANMSFVMQTSCIRLISTITLYLTANKPFLDDQVLEFEPCTCNDRFEFQGPRQTVAQH